MRLLILAALIGLAAYSDMPAEKDRQHWQISTITGGGGSSFGSFRWVDSWSDVKRVVNSQKDADEITIRRCVKPCGFKVEGE